MALLLPLLRSLEECNRVLPVVRDNRIDGGRTMLVTPNKWLKRKFRCDVGSLLVVAVVVLQADGTTIEEEQKQKEEK